MALVVVFFHSKGTVMNATPYYSVLPMLMKLTGVTNISSAAPALALPSSGLHLSVVRLHPAFAHAHKLLSVLTNTISSSSWPSLTCDVIP